MPKAIRKLPSAEYLHQRLTYDRATGELYWRHRPQQHFQTHRAFNAWNAHFAGRVAGSRKHNGYWFVWLDGRSWHAARIIYKMHHLVETGFVDHKDRDPGNNRLNNLREATRQENNRNKRQKVTASGLPGAYRSGDKFFSTIWDGTNRRYLGSFHTAEAAHAAYREASIRIFGEFSPFHEAS